MCFGYRPPDLLLPLGFFMSVDLIREDPGLALFHRRLAVWEGSLKAA
jgi:hypothetical protein